MAAIIIGAEARFSRTVIRPAYQTILTVWVSVTVPVMRRALVKRRGTAISHENVCITRTCCRKDKRACMKTHTRDCKCASKIRLNQGQTIISRGISGVGEGGGEREKEEIVQSNQAKKWFACRFFLKSMHGKTEDVFTEGWLENKLYIKQSFKPPPPLQKNGHLYNV